MNEVPTLLQVVVFGDFSILEANPETVRYFMDAFDDLNLIPSLPEVPAGGTFQFSIGPVPPVSPKVSFRSPNSPWSVTFAQYRLDIYCQKGGIEGPQVGPIDFFLDRSKRIIESAHARVPMTFNRMSFVTRHSWINWDDGELDSWTGRHLSFGSFYAKNSPQGLAARLESRVQSELLDGEVLNVISTLVRAKLITTPANPTEGLVDGIECFVDINTTQDSQEARFDLHDLAAFLKEANIRELEIRGDAQR